MLKEEDKIVDVRQQSYFFPQGKVYTKNAFKTMPINEKRKMWIISYGSNRKSLSLIIR